MIARGVSNVMVMAGAARVVSSCLFLHPARFPVFRVFWGKQFSGKHPLARERGLVLLRATSP